MELISTVIVLTGITLGLGWLLLSARARLGSDDNELIDAIDALLPQTQCAQCGYPGCRPYAEAVAAGAAIDLCPPGGSPTFEGLKTLLGRSEGVSPPVPESVLARIREEDCIGCFLCIRTCPVDAIIGAPGFMHTVIEDECTGCELCVPACPVDCIDLFPSEDIHPQASSSSPWQEPGVAPLGEAGWVRSKHPPGKARGAGISGMLERRAEPSARVARGGTPRTKTPSGRMQRRSDAGGLLPRAARPPGEIAATIHASPPCIGCNRCEPVCPAGLAPRELLWLSNAGKWDAASALGLDLCIECRLCDRVCPSEIPLAAIFACGKLILAGAAAKNAQAAHARARFEARTARLAAEQDAAQARRAERLRRQQRPASAGEALPR